MESVDLIVIGAGPAGSAAAIRYLQLRPTARVVLLDKSAFPRDKPCGDGLGPDAVSELVALGAAEILYGRIPVTSVILQSPSGRRVTGHPPRPGFVVPRFELDAALVAVAQRMGAQLLCERVESVSDLTHAGVVINERFRAPVVIAADGANSRTRSLLGEPRAPDHHAAFAVRGYVKAPHDALEIRWERRLYPAYSWLFPVGDGRVNVGFGCLHSQLRDPRPKVELWSALREAVGLEIPEESLRAHRLPFTTAKLSRSSGSVLFAGDAAGMINPLSGEGIYYALATGRMAASAATLSAGNSVAYEHAVRRVFGAHFRSTSLSHLLQRIPRNIDAAVSAASKSPEVFDDLVEIALGRGTLTPAVVSAVARNWLRT